MDPVWKPVSDFFFSYWNAAVTPLHHLTWQTFSLAATLALLVMFGAAVLLRYSWRFRKPSINNATIKRHHHKYEGHLRVSPADYRAFHRLKDSLRLDEGAGADYVTKGASKYYVVTLVETERRKVVLYREMRLHVPLRKGVCKANEVQLDALGLTNVRLENGFEEDDDAESEVAGTYDVYLRRIRFYDLRHWLMHPVREIRTVVWVTLITTTLPVLLDVFFG